MELRFPIILLIISAFIADQSTSATSSEITTSTSSAVLSVEQTTTATTPASVEPTPSATTSEVPTTTSTSVLPVDQTTTTATSTTVEPTPSATSSEVPTTTSTSVLPVDQTTTTATSTTVEPTPSATSSEVPTTTSTSVLPVEQTTTTATSTTLEPTPSATSSEVATTTSTSVLPVDQITTTATATTVQPTPSATSSEIPTTTSTSVLPVDQITTTATSTTVEPTPSATSSEAPTTTSISVLPVEQTTTIATSTTVEPTTRSTSSEVSTTRSTFVLSTSPTTSATSTTLIASSTSTLIKRGTSILVASISSRIASTPSFSTSISASSSIIPQIKLPLNPDDELRVDCEIKINTTYKATFLDAQSVDFKNLQSTIHSILSNIYKLNLGNSFYSVAVTNAFNASHLNTGVKYRVVFNTTGDSSVATENGMKDLLRSVSQGHLEGRTYNTVKFEKNTFLIITKSVVLPVKKNEITISAEIKIIETWDDAYLNKKSQKYINLKTDIEHTLQRTFQFLKGFIKAIVRSFRKGSVVIEYDLIFDNQKTSSTDLTVVQQKVDSAMNVSISDTLLGNYRVVPNSFKITKATSGGTSVMTTSKVPTWLIILIAVLCFLLILLIFFVWLQKKRKHGNKTSKQSYSLEEREAAKKVDEIYWLKEMGRNLNAVHGIPRAKQIDENTDSTGDVGVVNVSFVAQSGHNQNVYDFHSIDLGTNIDAFQKYKEA